MEKTHRRITTGLSLDELAHAHVKTSTRIISFAQTQRLKIHIQDALEIQYISETHIHTT